MKDQNETVVYTAYDDESPADEIEPEKHLLRAVLTTALEDLRKDGDLARRALAYFLSKEENYLFSFRSICQFLEIDPKRFLILAGIRGAPIETASQEQEPSTESE